MGKTKKVRNFVGDILLSLFSLLMFFLLAEGIMRFSIYFQSRKSFQEVLAQQPVLKPGDPAVVADIIKLSKYPGIIYELKPNLKAEFEGAPLEVNSVGWRGKQYSFKKDKNAVRIVGLGDSHMFGWGVSNEQTYINVLENMLNAKFPQRKWENINTAAPGYNTYMEIETLRNRALVYDPDIVLIEYIGNDLDLPNFLSKPTDFMNFRKSFFWAFLRGRISFLKTKISLIGAPTFIDPITGGVRCEGMNDVSRVPKQYRDMVGWEGFKNSLLKLKKFQDEKGFVVVICISQVWPPSIPEKVMDLSRQLGFYVLYSPQNIHDPAMILSKEDPHPSALAHKFIADNIFNFMVENHILDKFVNR